MIDWYFIAEQPAIAPHLARPEARGALHTVLITVPRVSRSCGRFADGFDLHLPQLCDELTMVSPVCREYQTSSSSTRDCSRLTSSTAPSELMYPTTPAPIAQIAQIAGILSTEG